MPVVTSIDLLAALSQNRVLDARHLEQVVPLAARFPNPREMATEMVRTGQLTEWQAGRVLLGRAAELVLDQYVLLDLLGQGGMGEVYKARQVRMQRLVALKVIRKESLASSTALGRFQREAMSAARLSHPNIVIVHDANEINGIPFLVMEFIEGTDLARLVKERGPLPAEYASDYIRQAALGLQHVHERGLIHRDVKPANLMLTALGLVKVMDLGLVRETYQDGPNAGTDLTNTGAVMGTPAFLSPEQALDAKRVDIRSDIYSLGCTFHYLLTARPPFVGESMTEILLKHHMSEPPAIESMRADMPSGLGDVLRKMLAKKADQRYATPGEAADALEPFAVFAAPTVRRPSKDTKTLRRLDFRSLPEPAAVGDQRPLPTRVVGPLTEVPAATVVTANSVIAVPPTWGDEFVNAIGMKLRHIPAGKFLMGSPADEAGRGDDEARRPVEIARPVYLGIYPVTQGEYERVVGHNPSHFSPQGGDRDFIQEQDTRRFPVERIGWDEAVEFCRLLSELPEEKAAHRHYRLPTEAEWEYACRAGSQTPFHGGASLDSSQANFDGNQPYGTGERGPYLSVTTPVGNYPANAWGLHDMHGNVWEWCADSHGTEGDDMRVARGGSFYSAGQACRAAHREKYAGETRDFDLGFRVVCVSE